MTTTTPRPRSWSPEAASGWPLALALMLATGCATEPSAEPAAEPIAEPIADEPVTATSGPSALTASSRTTPPVALPSFPADRAGGRLRVLDLRPASGLGAASVRGLLSRWGACVADAPRACGHQVFAVSTDRHDLRPSIAIYTETLDGAASACLQEEARHLPRTPEQDPVWAYRVALVVAPTADEMERCSAGVAAAVARWVVQDQAGDRRAADELGPPERVPGSLK